MADNSGAEKTSSPVREIVRKGRALWWTGCLLILAALVILVLWKAPQLQVKYAQDIPAKDRFSSENEARKTLATILGGIVVLAGAYFTWRNIKVAQKGQITDRFSKAIEQLGAVDASGKKKLEVRLGGIYALEGIANESKELHWPTMEVLSTYVRVHAVWKNAPSEPPLAADIQAILTVLGRRDRKYEQATQVLDLSNTDIRWARLSKADLRAVKLFLADLQGADLTGAILHGADLRAANLSGPYEADLSGADLRRALNLTQQQIDKAKGDSTTQLPSDLHMPESWKK